MRSRSEGVKFEAKDCTETHKIEIVFYIYETHY